ncbi:MAG: DUF502 domain-containing protein [Deinococcus sp.]|nr:DUF502 domain-containing protein [Deinococcus sp.]
MRKLQSTLVAGLLVVLPVGITLYLVAATHGWLTTVFATLHRRLVLKDPADSIWPLLPFVGLSFLVLLTYLVGLAVRTFIGRRLLLWSEWAIATVPLLRDLYSATKQIAGTLLGEHAADFSRVALVQYPETGGYVLGFVASHVGRQVLPDQDLTALLLPTTPLPHTGWVAFVPTTNVHRLDISAEDAVKILVSGGLVLPKEQKSQDSGP